MNRRGFLGGLAALVASPVVATHATPRPTPTPELPRIEPADGKRFILGIAAQSVRAGDLVQIQTYGPATVKMQ